MRKLKNQAIRFYEFVLLLWRNKKHYIRFYFKEKRNLYRKINEKGINRIKPHSRADWKVNYKCVYFSGLKKDSQGNNIKVFVKSLGPFLEDCYNNEIIVNKFIEENSDLLSSCMPHIYDYFVIDDYYFIVSEFINIKHIDYSDELEKAVDGIINEYNRIGIIHTDFSLSNIGKHNNKIYFFDYGTAICPLSNNIRIRNQAEYNHLSQISSSAKKIFDDPDFYYEDSLYFGLKKNSKKNNYIVGKGDCYCVKLGNTFYNYRIQLSSNSSKVYLLSRC